MARQLASRNLRVTVEHGISPIPSVMPAEAGIHDTKPADPRMRLALGMRLLGTTEEV